VRWPAASGGCRRELGGISSLTGLWTGLWTGHFSLGTGRTGPRTRNWIGSLPDLFLRNCSSELKKSDGKSSILGQMKGIGARKFEKM
jgi:hypothetical protein